MLDIEKLKASWTKYSAVQVIDVVSSLDEIKAYTSKIKNIDDPILIKFLGVTSLSDEIPAYWNSIQNYPDQKRLFALLAAIFTHHNNIVDFSEYASGDMKGIFKIKPGKQYTNLRSALVEAGASANSDRRKEEVPYDFSVLYEKGEVGVLFKSVIEDRLKRIDWDGKNLIEVAISLGFHKAMSLSEANFKKWLNGEKLIETRLKYQLDKLKNYSEIKTYKVNQWLTEWDNIDFSSEEMRNKPDPFFVMFKIDARLLKRLSDVHRRSAIPDRESGDQNLQRTHNISRSVEIHNYIHGGYPWSTISREQQTSDQYKGLKMPGILPTAIIANILIPGAERGNKQLLAGDEIVFTDKESDFPSIKLPQGVFSEDWSPQLKPIEIIDGQHRLWAFDEKEDLAGRYEVPVIAYYNLDRAWQAYLFYTINIKPVKINTSLGYDLYPLLRTQKWLEDSKEGLLFYRENRAQELVESIWSYKESPWKGRIKMLGEGIGNISQAAFIKALTSSFLKKRVERTTKSMGGLFSDIIKKDVKIQVLNWNRSQQVAFLILLWDLISEKLNGFVIDDDKKSAEPTWARLIRENEPVEENIDGEHPAFTSKNSFLSRDQGVRGISMFANDFFYCLATTDEWDLNELTWKEDLDDKVIQSQSIDEAISEFKKHRLYSVMQDFASEIIKIDWRTTSADFSDDEKIKIQQMRYKGGSGYSEVWKDLINSASKSDSDEIRKYTEPLKELL